MSSPFTRRQYLTAAGAVVAGTALSIKAKETLDGSRPKMPYRGRRNAGLQTAEPLVTDTDVSTDPSDPDSYAALVRTREEADERYRVDYLRNEYDTDVSQLYTVDYETEFVAIIGYVLPSNRHLDFAGQEYEDGTLYTSNEITESRGPNHPKSTI